MNFKCLICSDLFIAGSDITSTPCGHLFHYTCLLQWIDRSQSCPQCRSKATEKTIHRIYISVDDNATGMTDVSSLQNHIDNLNFQLKMKSMDVENAKEKLKASKQQTIGLRKEVKELEDQLKVLDSASYALKDQIKYFKNKSKECDRLEEEAVILKNKINELESVQLVITGSREQVNDMLRHNRDAESLTILVSTLKKELIDSDRKRKQVEVMLRDCEMDVRNKIHELMVLSKENMKLLEEVREHKNCESERKYLKSKISELKASASSTSKESYAHTSFDRIMLESPVPLPKDKHFSPAVPEKVQAIKDSDSPYLQVQSSSVGLSELMNFSHHNMAKKTINFKGSKP